MDRFDEMTEAWLESLRYRVERGDFHGLGPVDLNDGFELSDGEAAVREILAWLVRYHNLPPEWRTEPSTQARAGLLLEDLRRVDDQLRAQDGLGCILGGTVGRSR